MNVLIYVLDSLRADHLSCYGYHRETSPTIDKLADDGVIFENCMSPSTWTRPVAASIFTGLYPPVHGTEGHRDAFNPPVPPLAAQFQECGYETYGLSSGRNLQGSWGFDKGFGTFCDLFNHEEVLTSNRAEAPQFDDGTPLARAEDINMAFRDWFNTQYDNEKPFFALLWSNETHLPYSPPPAYRHYADVDYDGPIDPNPDQLSQFDIVEDEKDIDQLQAYYDGEILYNDNCLGEIIEFMKEKDVYEDTLIIVTGDHGDAFGEHGEFGHAGGIKPYSEVVHVPFVVRPPTDEIMNRTVRSATSLVDIYPMLVAATDVIPAKRMDDRLQGRILSLEPTNDDSFEDRLVFAKTMVERSYGATDIWYAARKAEWKYIRFDPEKRTLSTRLKLFVEGVDSERIRMVIEKPFEMFQSHANPSSNTLLYNLDQDPAERHECGTDRIPLSKCLNESIDVWIDTCEELKTNLGTEEQRIDISAPAQERLDQLGYMSN